MAGPGRTAPLPDQPGVLWKRRIGGGYSGPVVSGDRLWVHSREGNDEVVRCLRLADGEAVWRQAYEVPFRQDDDALSHGLGPFATPALADGRLFTFGITSVVIAWDASSGELLWRRDSADEFNPAYPYFGNASSPVVWEDLVFVHLGGQERQPMANPSLGAMLALRVTDGQEVWRWTGDQPSVGATPVLTEIDGIEQLVFKTLKLIVGVEPRTGRELWRMPYPVSQDNTIVTPLFVDGHLITSDYDLGIGAWAIEPQGSDWNTRPLWKHREVSMFMSSPVLAGGLVVGFSHLRRGQLFLLDPGTGEVRWQGSPRRGEHATLIAWGDEVLVFTDDGALVIGRVEGDRFRELKPYRLGRGTGWAHPAVVGTRLVYRDGEDLTACLLEPR